MPDNRQIESCLVLASTQRRKMTMTSSKRSHRQACEDGQESAASPHTSKRGKPSPDATNLVKLDPEGDAILVVGNSSPGPAETNEQRKFLVSSKLLSLASPVFSKMFSPQFQEGIRIRNGEVPYIPLEEDNATLMEVILRILHFQSEDISFDLSRAEFASIAIHSDKYDCRRALRGWVRGWWLANKFDDLSDLSSEDIGLTLLAAYMFRFQRLPELATAAARYLTPDFLPEWERHHTLSLLPVSLTGKLNSDRRWPNLLTVSRRHAGPPLPGTRLLT